MSLVNPHFLFLNTTTTISYWRQRLSNKHCFGMRGCVTDTVLSIEQDKFTTQGYISLGSYVSAFIVGWVVTSRERLALKALAATINAGVFRLPETVTVFIMTDDESIFETEVADFFEKYPKLLIESRIEFYWLNSSPTETNPDKLDLLNLVVERVLLENKPRTVLSDVPAPRSIAELAQQRNEWYSELLDQNGFWDMTTLIDVFTGEVYSSREAYVVSVTAMYEPKFRAHLSRAKDVNLTVKALSQTDLNQITLIIKPAELDVSVKDNSPFANHPD